MTAGSSNCSSTPSGVRDIFYFRQACYPDRAEERSKVDPEVRREIIAEWVQQHLKIDLGILEDSIARDERCAALSATQNTILVVLEGRFGAKARTLETKIKAIGIFEDDRLDELLKHAATCRTLGSFRKQLRREIVAIEDERGRMGLSPRPGSRLCKVTRLHNPIVLSTQPPRSRWRSKTRSRQWMKIGAVASTKPSVAAMARGRGTRRPATAR